ncbi:hypothetical protein RBB50_000153 [Rhinocladiella similis]
MTDTATGRRSPELDFLLTSTSTSSGNETSTTVAMDYSSRSSPPSSPESSPGTQHKTTGLFGRIFGHKEKGLKDLLAQDVESQQRAREEAKEQALRRQRETNDRISDAKLTTREDEAQGYEDAKKSHKAEEKSTKRQYLSGILYGYDPNAGKLRVNHGHQVSSTDETGADETPLQPSEILDSKRKRGETWGVDHNNPDMRDRFRRLKHGDDDHVDNGNSS